MAGLYEFWRDTTLPDDHPRAWWVTCTVITTEAETDAAGGAAAPAEGGPRSLADIHPRMPLMLTPDRWDAWLDPARTDPDDLRELLAPPPPGLMRAYPVSTDVSNVRNNGPELLEELAAPGGGHRSSDRASDPARRRRRGDGPCRMRHDARVPTSVETPAGDGPHHLAPAREGRALVLALGHGAGGGIEARDLQALAAALPAHGVTVALVEQPWRVAGKKLAPAPEDAGRGLARRCGPRSRKPGLPVVAGGRSAGARVACRTADRTGRRRRARAVLPAAPAGQAGEVPRRRS